MSSEFIQKIRIQYNILLVFMYAPIHKVKFLVILHVCDSDMFTLFVYLFSPPRTLHNGQYLILFTYVFQDYLM